MNGEQASDTTHDIAQDQTHHVNPPSEMTSLQNNTPEPIQETPETSAEMNENAEGIQFTEVNPDATNAPVATLPNDTMTIVAPVITQSVIATEEGDQWAEIDAEGNVYLKETAVVKRRIIGKLRGKDKSSTYASLITRFREQEEKANIMQTALEGAEDKRVFQGRVRAMLEYLQTANALGDYDTLIGRLNTMTQQIEANVQQIRKLNFDGKAALVAQAETLSQSTDWKNTADQMKALFEDWKKIGSAGREDDDALWAKFNAARDTFFNHRRQHFEAIDKAREELRNEKEKLCIEAESQKESTDWDATGEKLKALQTKWKTIGFAGRIVDDQLWERFHTACDHFFNRRIEHYRTRDKERDEARAQKEQLCERAETLLEYSRGANVDFKAIAEAFKDLQVEWKRLKSAGHRFDDKLWDRFRAAADEFFERRDDQMSQARFENRERMKEAFERKNEQLDRLKESIQRDESNLARWRESMATARPEFKAELEAKIADVSTRLKDKQERLRELISSVSGMQRRMK